MYGLPNYAQYIKCELSRQFLVGSVHMQVLYNKYGEGNSWGLITIVDNVVAYRDPLRGRLLINSVQADVTSLGPVQEVGGLIITGISRLWWKPATMPTKIAL
jgi:hypothetical protein